MTRYKQIIASLTNSNPAQAEIFEEEIDLIIHKLKFLTEENLPKVAILSQKNNFEIVNNNLLSEKVKLAGGTLITDILDDPQVIIIIQESNELYQTLPTYISDLKTKKTRAILENKIYILNSDINIDNDELYLRDAEILAEIIQNKYFVYGREGSDWLKFDLV